MKQAVNRKTKTTIELYQISDAWVVNCLDHDQCCEFETKREAHSFAAHPDNFCSECAAKVGA